MKGKNRGVCVALALLLALSALTFAQAEEQVWGYRSDRMELNGYTGPGGEVTVPAQVDGQSVLMINYDTFYGRNDITAVTFPEGIIALGVGVLNDPQALERVTLPETLQAIDDSVLYFCPALREVTVPASVRFIGRDFLGNCEGLESVTFEGVVPAFSDPDSVLNWGNENSVIYVPEDQVEAYRAALTKVADERIQSSGRPSKPHTEVSATWTMDAESGTLLKCETLDTWVEIPAEIDEVPVRAIGENAFRSCANLYAVIIPEGVETIGTCALGKMNHLALVELPDSVTSIGKEAFQWYRGTSIHMPAQLTEVLEDAFDSSYLNGVLTLPERLQYIGERAFRYTRLEDVYFPAGLVSIGANAFEGWSVGYLVFEGLELPEIGVDAFKGQPLSDVDLNWIASKETMLSVQALFDSWGFTARVWRAQNPYVSYPERGAMTVEGGYVTSYTGSKSHLRAWDSSYDADNNQIPTIGIAEEALAGNQVVTYFSVPHSDEFTDIRAGAFRNSAVETVDLFDSVTDIGAEAFRGSQLTSLVLPASVERIGEYAFADCGRLTEITIACDPAIIPATAFVGCDQVRSLTIPGREGEDPVALADALGLQIPSLMPTPTPSPTPTPTPTPEPTPTPTPTPEPTPEPTSEPIPVSDEVYALYGGTWYLREMRMGESVINPADYGISITMQLNADGTASSDDGDSPMEGQWRAEGDGVCVIVGAEATGVLTDGQLVLDDGEQTLILSREQPEGVSYVPAPVVEVADESAFAGTWQAEWFSASGMMVSVQNEELKETWMMLFGSEDTTLTVEGTHVAWFGHEEDFDFQNGRLEKLESIPEMEDDSLFQEYVTLHEDGMLRFTVLGMEIYCSRVE